MAVQSAGARERFALLLVQLGAIAVVLVAAPYKSFDLDRFFVPKELVVHLTAFGAALLCFVPRRRLAATPVDVLLAAFIVLSGASTLFALNWWLATRALALSISGVLLFWVGVRMRRAGLHRVVLVGAAVAVVLGVLTALIQAYAGPVTEYFSLNRAPGGTFGNRNFMAHLAVIGTPAVALAALSARSRARFAFGALGSVLLAAGLVLSRSRAAWVALAAAAIVIGAVALLTRVSISGGRTWGRLRILAIAAAVGALGAAFLPNQLEWKSDSPYLDSVKDVVNYKEGSGAGRLVQYTTSMKMALAHPILGVGPGNWGVAYPKYAAPGDQSLSGDSGMTDNPWPSSDWVAFVSERGLIATGCLVLALLGLVLRSIADLRRSRDDGDLERSTAALMLIGTVTASVVVGLFDAVLLIAVPTLFLWLLAGVLAPPVDAKRELSPRLRWAAPMGLLLIGVLAVARSATQLQAMAMYNGTNRVSMMERAALFDPGSYRIQLRLAEAYVARGDCAAATRHARAARRLYPNAVQPRTVLRRCGLRS